MNDKRRRLTVALAGNPNSGKSTLFNALTAAEKEVANWPGVTVEWAIGDFYFLGYRITLVDLPGIYSLFPEAAEKRAVSRYLLGEGATVPDIIVDVIDAGNLERSLYLASQLAEAGLPLIVALNMEDELAARQTRIDERLLAAALGAPCLKISAAQNKGLLKLCAKIINYYEGGGKPDHGPKAPPKSARPWPGESGPQAAAGGGEGEDPLSSERYRLIAEMVKKVTIPSERERPSLSPKKPRTKRKRYRGNHPRGIDRIVCHRVLALPLFILVMAAVFYLSFGPLARSLVDSFTYLTLDLVPGAVNYFLELAGTPLWFDSLVMDGIIAGVGGVMVFLPQLFILYLCLAVLEDSGYMARAAFVTDRFLSCFGLGGNAFIPLVLGFGCSVPAITACRGFVSKRARLLAMLVIPFISCSGRLPVYALFTAIFFASNRVLVMSSIYFLGIAAGLLSALILKPLVLKGGRSVFIMEMPPYRLPKWSAIAKRAWRRVRDFIYRAGSAILVVSVIIWFLNYFDWQLQVAGSAGTENMLRSFAKFLAPLFSPLGFGHWQMAVALLTGLMNKEAVVSGLSILYADSSVAALPQLLASILTPLEAYSFMVFVLLYVPCVATLITIRRESGSFLFMFFVVLYQFTAAWLCAFLIFQGGSFLGLG